MHWNSIKNRYLSGGSQASNSIDFSQLQVKMRLVGEKGCSAGMRKVRLGREQQDGVVMELELSVFLLMGENEARSKSTVFNFIMQITHENYFDSFFLTTKFYPHFKLKYLENPASMSTTVSTMSSLWTFSQPLATASFHFSVQRSQNTWNIVTDKTYIISFRYFAFLLTLFQVLIYQFALK